jgi:hypothetical protein
VLCYGAWKLRYGARKLHYGAQKLRYGAKKLRYGAQEAALCGLEAALCGPEAALWSPRSQDRLPEMLPEPPSSSNRPKPPEIHFLAQFAAGVSGLLDEDGGSGSISGNLSWLLGLHNAASGPHNAASRPHNAASWAP